MSELDNLIKSNTVFVFSGTYCPFYDLAKEQLTKMNIKFGLRNMDIEPFQDPKIEKKLDNISGIDTIPKIFIGKQCIGGYSDMQELVKSGEFYELLDSEGIQYTKL